MKKSNKFLMASLLMTLTMSGCGPTGTSSSAKPSSNAGTTSSQISSSKVENNDPVISALAWTGVENKSVAHKAIFAAFGGVSLKATTPDGEIPIPTMFLTATAEGATLNDNKVDTSTLNVGDTFKVTYGISEDFVGYQFASGLELTKTITVTIIEALSNMAINGDFENGETGWNTEGVPASGTFTIEADGDNHYAKLDVTGDSGNSYQPRINTDQRDASYGLRLEAGKNYQLSYRAKADTAREIFVQIGRILGAEPWFYLYKNTYQQLTTEWATYTMTFGFTANAETGGDVETEGHIVFECGKVNGTYTAGAVYFDDVVFSEYEGDIPDEEKPVISGASYLRVDTGATLDLMAGVTATDARDGDITDKITYTIAKFEDGTAVETIDTSVEAKYKVTYRVSDAAGNEAVVVRTIRVCDPSAADENAFTAPTSVKNGGEGDAALNPGTLYEWHDQWWCGSNVAVSNCSWEDDSLILNYTSEGSCWFGMQVFYACPDMLEGNYTLTFNVQSSIAGTVTFNGQLIDLVIGANAVTVTAPVTGANGITTLNFQFGASGTSTMVPEGNFVFTDFAAYPA